MSSVCREAASVCSVAMEEDFDQTSVSSQIRLNLLTRLSTFASTANFLRGVTPRDGVVCRESSRIASRNAV